VSFQDLCDGTAGKIVSQVGQCALDSVNSPYRLILKFRMTFRSNSPRRRQSPALADLPSQRRSFVIHH
jgi:hypothetical protein